MYKMFFKRFLDIVLSLIAIVLLSPIYIIVALLVRIKLGSPVIFYQERPGLHEKKFTLYKFRTMTNEKDEAGNYLHDDLRITRFGKYLRSTSLDELPELFNILKGDMSIIGPRPLLLEYLPFYKENERKRHDVRPGLTGYAQINGRNAIEWEKKFELDIYYVNNLSFILDLKIIFKTIHTVFTHEGIQVGSEIKAGRFDDYRRKNFERSKNKTC